MPSLLPDAQPDPDINRLLTTLQREGETDRVPFFELLADAPLMEAILGEPLTPRGLEGEDAFMARTRNEIRFWHGMGYDYYTVRLGHGLDLSRAKTPDTAELGKGVRAWVQQESGVVTNREEFERFPWPGPTAADEYDYIPDIAHMLPDGMGLAVRSSGILENTMWLMGYEGISFSLADDADLVRDVFGKVGTHATQMFSAALEHREVRAVVLGDDMGFKTQTMLPPDLLREFVFPWQKKLVDIAHAAGCPFVLHSCGNISAVMEDLIEDVGIDARHSFEDAIEPVADAKRRYGDRIAILGGVDVDKLCRLDESSLRAWVREIIRSAAPGGGYALGSGNSLANYIRPGNYLAMIDEGRKHGRYPIRL